MVRLLLDANISPETKEYLIRVFDFDVIDLITEKKATLTDEEVILLAKKEKRVIITFDLDFGELYHFREEGKVGIIILRLEDQTVESVNRILHRFFLQEVGKVKLDQSLIVVEEDKVRRY